MIRKTLRATALQAEVSRRIHEIVEDGVKIRVPRPQLHQPDATECNWEMKYFGDAIGYEPRIAMIVKAVQAGYSLSTETQASRHLFGLFPDH